jgi:hypothetical protein
MTAPVIFEQSVQRTSESAPANSPSPMPARIVRGRDAVLSMQPLLEELARRCVQPGVADHLPYFFSLDASLRKTPYLVLLGAWPGAFSSDRPISADDLAGAAILFEYRLLGIGIGVFAPEDLTGRRCVIAPPDRRAEVMASAACVMIARHAHVLLLAMQHDGPDTPREPDSMAAIEPVLHACCAGLPPGRRLWSIRQEDIPAYLPLRSSFEETVSGLSQKTRYNLRYYRRRATRDLGCTFVSEARLSLDDLLALNRACSFPVEEKVVRWRHSMMDKVRGGFLCGLRDRDGRWLALLRGRRSGQIVEVDWQMNRGDLPNHSLSVVTRSFLIEQSIALGCTRIYMEGGTKHPISRSFADASITELTVMRQNLYARLARRFAPRIAPHWNRLAQFIADPAARWHRW